MKKFIALLLVLTMALALVACGSSGKETAATPTPGVEPSAELSPEATAEAAPTEETVEETAEELAAEEPVVMSYAEFTSAEVDAPVTVEAYVQAHLSWWDNKISLYAQNEDGAYFCYDMACAEEDVEKLVPGQKIRVTGYKAEWSGEVEIADASFELVEGEGWIAEPLDITGLLGSDELSEHINQVFSVSGAVVADKGDGAAFFYNWDNSGEDGDCDLYFDVEVNDGTYTFVVRRYLTEPGGEVYEAVKNLKVGDTVDLEGFLYWYEGPQPHITAITVK